MKLQRWRIKLNEFDFSIKYLPGKENQVANALSRVKLDKNFLGESPDSTPSLPTIATIHSAQEDNQNYIEIAERPLNYYNRQIEFHKGNSNEVKLTQCFHKTNLKIMYKEMTHEYAKELIKEHLCSKKSVIYFPCEMDFIPFQNAFIEIICTNNLTKVMKTSTILTDVKTFAEFKEIVLKAHVELLHKGIETVNRLNENQNENQRLAILIFNLQEFTEYVEDIKSGMQFTRLGIFNPKLLKHDPLKHINSEKLLNIKTSTWLQVNTNEILIISHIPRTIIKTPIYKILPYPDQNQNIITVTLHDEYYIKNQQVFKVKTRKES